MRTERERYELFEDIFGRMLSAGWLKKFTFTQGKGWHLGWTATGAQEVIYLKQLRHELELGAADERPVLASILAHGITPDTRSDAKTINAALRPFLREGLAFRAAFVHGIYCDIDWTPKGEDFRRRLTQVMADLTIEMADEDRLIALFLIADTWAPDVNTKIAFE